MKTAKSFFILIFILIGIGAFIFAKKNYFGLHPYTESRSAFNRPEVEDEIVEHGKVLSRLDQKWDHLENAKKLESKGEYEAAIEEIIKSLEYTNVDDASAWVSRRALGRAYEKAEKYSLALQELEWAESVQVRPDVLEKLAEDRKRLEALISSQT